VRLEFESHVIELQSIGYSLKLNEANIQTAERNVNVIIVERNHRSFSKLGVPEGGE